jgi:hypothetical protein
LPEQWDRDSERNIVNFQKLQFCTLLLEYPSLLSIGPFEFYNLLKMSSIPSSFLYQAPPDAALKAQYIGQRIEDVQAPAAVIDVAVVKWNCTLMLNAAEALKVQFRAHVKTHKVCLDF